jgi:hypothetical protein
MYAALCASIWHLMAIHQAIAKRVKRAKPDMVDLLNKECTSCNLKTPEREGSAAL